MWLLISYNMKAQKVPTCFSKRLFWTFVKIILDFFKVSDYFTLCQKLAFAKLHEPMPVHTSPCTMLYRPAKHLCTGVTGSCHPAVSGLLRGWGPSWRPVLPTITIIQGVHWWWWRVCHQDMHEGLAWWVCVYIGLGAPVTVRASVTATTVDVYCCLRNWLTTIAQLQNWAQGPLLPSLFHSLLQTKPSTLIQWQHQLAGHRVPRTPKTRANMNFLKLVMSRQKLLNTKPRNM